MRVAILISLLLFQPAAADPYADLYGTWGSAEQCERAPIQAGGTVLAEPYEIGTEWLRHGQIWCRLSWFPVEPRDGGLFTGAFAHCGEDSVRSYLLGIVLSDDRLTLRWNVMRSTGSLERCRGADGRSR